MRERFRAYYRPTDGELDQIWKQGIIVLDTNTLLNLFRYTPGTRDEFLGVLDKLHDNLWIPYHVGLEFHQRRLDVINGTLDAFEKVKESLAGAQKNIATTLDGYKHHPSLNRNELLKEVDEFFEAFRGKLEQKRVEHADRLGSKGDAEQTFERISDLFFGKVGQAFSEQELEAIYEEGEKRYSAEIPPGFKDKGKDNSNRYGDLVIWKEILALGREKKKPVIFVTDDSKEDWWWRSGGKTQGPRVELVDEYWAQSEQRIHFYEPLRFLEYAKKQTDAEVSRQSLDEVQEVSSAKSRAHRILQDRQAALEEQRAQALTQLERMQTGEETGSFRRHAEGVEKLESLVREQRSLEAHLDELRKHTELLMRNVDVRQGDSESVDLMEQIAAAKEDISILERHLSFLRRRRESLELDISRGGSRGRGGSTVWHSRMRQLQNELDEVNLALEELDD